MLKTLFLVSAATLTLASASAMAAPGDSGVYAVEPSHTEVVFAVNHLGFSTYYGQFPGASGSLTLDAANPAGSKLDISVPTATVWTASPLLTHELTSAGWLDAAQFPAMTFHATKIVSTGADTADVTGDLTLHGVTHSVTLKAKFNKAGPNPMSKVATVGFEVSGVVKRSDYGVSKYVPFVGDDVQLIISAAFEKKAG